MDNLPDDSDELFRDRLLRVREGDSRAFDDLVRWLERPLLGFLRARGADDPDGTANEALLRMFHGIGRFDGGAMQFRAWVFRIARNLLIDEHRYRARRPDAVPTADDRLPEQATPDSALDRLADRERVDTLLAELTDEQREVLLLRVIAGLGVEATADVVGRRPGAVRSLQHRALNQLRGSLMTRP